MSYVFIFALVFIGGPLLLRNLTRSDPGARSFQLLALFSALCAVVGLGLHSGLAGQGAWVSVTGAISIWAGWVGVLAYGTQSLRMHDNSRKMHRLTAALGAAGTTVPWFGLASASLFTA